MCSIHWGYLVIILAYVGFLAFWMIGKKHRDFDAVIGLASGVYFLIGFIMAFFAKCPVCWALMIVGLVILNAVFAYSIVRQIKKNKQKAIDAMQAAIRRREIAAARAERKKAKQAEIAATENEKSGLIAQDVITKADIAQYLTKTYGNKVIVNGRSDMAKSDDQISEADAHYVAVDGKKICFSYVYENDERGMFLLLRMNNDRREELSAKHTGVERSTYQKKGEWTKVVIDNSYTEQEIFDIVSAAYETALKEDATKANGMFDKVDRIGTGEAVAMMSDEDAIALIESNTRNANKTMKGTVNIEVLDKYFSAGDTVTLDALKKRVPGFDNNVTYCKVLARGSLTKPLTVDLDDYSMEAAKMILLTGGRVISTRA